MPPTESTARAGRRQHVLVALLALAGIGLLVYMMGGSAVSPGAPSNQSRELRKPAPHEARGSLDVRLDELRQPPPEPADTKRNPFRYYVPPPPPPPPAPPRPTPSAGGSGPGGPPPGPAGPLPPPPIPVKFIGTLEQGTTKVAVFTDGSGPPVYAREGQTVLGRYKLVKIQVESVVMEYLDGRGRQTIPMRGQ